ncbi:hypothetical protein LguiA_005573 [Lonicera macranthoides]
MARLLRILSVVNSSSTPTLPEPAEPPESVAVESDFVVILAALLCAIICVVGLIAVARCTWLRRGTAAANGSSPRQPPANRGLKKKTLQSIPKLTYEPDSNGKIAAECAICLAEYAGGDEIRVLPQCGHGFHVGCIDTWLGSHSSCPSCRHILVVARCQKCGEYSGGSSGGGGGGGVVTESEMKAREDVASSGGFLP